jgi:hypothetical protein
MKRSIAYGSSLGRPLPLLFSLGARWIIYTDGFAETVHELAVATWAFAVFERVEDDWQLAGVRSGRVQCQEAPPNDSWLPAVH